MFPLCATRECPDFNRKLSYKLRRFRGINMKRWLSAPLGAASVLSVASPAAAYSECEAKVLGAFYALEGYIWINLDNGGGAAVVDKTDPNREAYLSILLTARATNKPIRIRFNHDASTCTATNYDIIGIWIP